MKYTEHFFNNVYEHDLESRRIYKDSTFLFGDDNHIFQMKVGEVWQPITCPCGCEVVTYYRGQTSDKFLCEECAAKEIAELLQMFDESDFDRVRRKIGARLSFNKDWLEQTAAYALMKGWIKLNDQI